MRHHGRMSVGIVCALLFLLLAYPAPAAAAAARFSAYEVRRSGVRIHWDGGTSSPGVVRVDEEARG